MGARPSALALAVAISRLGAVSVLLRPDGDVAREARLGQVSGSSPILSGLHWRADSATSTRSYSAAGAPRANSACH